MESKLKSGLIISNFPDLIELLKQTLELKEIKPIIVSTENQKKLTESLSKLTELPSFALIDHEALGFKNNRIEEILEKIDSLKIDKLIGISSLKLNELPIRSKERIGYDEVLHKPFDLEDLLTIIK